MKDVEADRWCLGVVHGLHGRVMRAGGGEVQHDPLPLTATQAFLAGA
jgi:hypothetical protein